MDVATAKVVATALRDWHNKTTSEGKVRRNGPGRRMDAAQMVAMVAKEGLVSPICGTLALTF